MSDPLVRRHDPAATPPADGAGEAARPALTPEPSPGADAAAQVVTLAQLLAAEAAEQAPPAPRTASDPDAHAEYGGPKGPEPTRYGDWEKGGRCIDF